jgi:ribosome-binding protein aMBF1 (putative translation factor)
MLFSSEVNSPRRDGVAYGQRHWRELAMDADTSTDDGSEILAALGAAIREHRTAVGLTQAQLAERAGIGRPHLNHIEGGRKSPTVVVLVHLARGLGVDPAALLQNQATQ